MFIYFLTYIADISRRRMLIIVSVSAPRHFFSLGDPEPLSFSRWSRAILVLSLTPSHSRSLVGSAPFSFSRWPRVTLVLSLGSLLVIGSPFVFRSSKQHSYGPRSLWFSSCCHRRQRIGSAVTNGQLTTQWSTTVSNDQRSGQQRSTTTNTTVNNDHQRPTQRSTTTSNHQLIGQ